MVLPAIVHPHAALAKSYGWKLRTFSMGSCSTASKKASPSKASKASALQVIMSSSQSARSPSDAGYAVRICLTCREIMASLVCEPCRMSSMLF